MSKTLIHCAKFYTQQKILRAETVLRQKCVKNRRYGIYYIFSFCIYLCESSPQQKMPDCKSKAFLSYFLLLSFIHVKFALPVDILPDVNNSADKAQPRTLCVLKMHSHFWLTLSAYLLFYVGTSCLVLSFFVSSSLFLVGSAHARTLFVKSVAKTFMFNFSVF